MKPNCLLLTWNYPFLPAEEPFILPELRALPERFSVRLRACTDRGTGKDAPIPCPVPCADAPRIDGFATRLAALTDGNLIKELLDAAKGSALRTLRRKAGYLFWSYYHAHAFARGLLRECRQTGFIPDVGYSFWGREGAYALLLLKKHYPSMRVVSRFHRCDLYLYAGIDNTLPFRNVFGNKLDILAFISEEGRKYWFSTFPCQYHERAQLHLLGCVSANIGIVSPKEGMLRLFSCSATRPVKRLDLLIKALEKTSDTIPIYWTHIGGGEGLDALSLNAKHILSNKTNIKYEFLGQVPNEEIRPLYVREGAGLFINVSESEGLPVSMMEAISVGIPLMGTDVGGVSELVGPDTGILLPADPSPEEIAGALERFFLLSAGEKRRLSENARALWAKRYDAEKNAGRFAKELEDLCASVANASQS